MWVTVKCRRNSWRTNVSSAAVWSAIVYIALSGTDFELLDVEKYRDLEIWIRGH